MSSRRKMLMDQLFEKWDNDGSGYLDQDEVENVMMKYKDGQDSEAIEKGMEINLFIILSLGSIKIDCVISETCILMRLLNYKKTYSKIKIWRSAKLHYTY